MHAETHLLSAHDFEDQELTNLFHEAYVYSLQDELQRYKRGSIPPDMFGRVMGTLFLEPSTRTRWSFETAFNKLGGKVVSTEAGDRTTSQVKGESLIDTIQTVSQYVDFLVVRSPEPLTEWGEPLYDQLIENCCVINAGDGTNEHPTQALTDAYTIYQRFQRLDRLTVGIVGDLGRSRTVHSLINLVGRDPENKFHLWGVGEKMDKDQEPVAEVNYEDPLDYSALKKCDVLYLNRIQKERWEDEAPESIFRLTHECLAAMKDDAIILNPGPRREEMSREFDKDPRVLYFRQARNGLYARMALLNYLNGQLGLVA